MFTVVKISIVITGLLVSLAAITGNHAAPARSGEAVFEASCAACHAGFLNSFFSPAPILGDEDDWAELTPKGVDALTASSIAGIGEMAARGGCADCSDAEIRAAVEYMLAELDE